MILAANSFRQEGVATMLYHQLTQEERYVISGGLRLLRSRRSMARDLGRAPSTMSREICETRRCTTVHIGGEGAELRGGEATTMSTRTAVRRGGPRGGGEGATATVEPRADRGDLPGAGKSVPSHETIYRGLRSDKARGGTLYGFMRIMSKTGRKHYRSPPTRGVLVGKRHITERAVVVDERGRIGDWEGDTVMGAGPRTVF